jgi:hypothetical protein
VNLKVRVMPIPSVYSSVDEGDPEGGGHDVNLEVHVMPTSLGCDELEVHASRAGGPYGALERVAASAGMARVTRAMRAKSSLSGVSLSRW